MNVDLKTQILAAGEAATAAAARCLAEGGLVGFPTETVYGLGADATNPEAVARLYQAKGRPSFNPLIAHVSELAAARRIGHFDAQATALAEAFWPGPLTLVLPKTADCAVADLATAGLDTVAIRIPAHAVARDILRAFGGPVVAPSANLSGHVSPTTAAHVQGDLAGRIDLIIDGGAVAVGVESTIVGCFETPMLLRPGGLPREAIERVLGRALTERAGTCRHRDRRAAGAGHAGVALRPADPGAAQCRAGRGQRGAAGVRPRDRGGIGPRQGRHEFVRARRPE